MIMKRFVLMGISKEFILGENFDYEKLINYEPEILNIFPENEHFIENLESDKLKNILDKK